ncbi:MAG: ATP-dependent DNA helicase, partial [Sciscionella sp.]|nr:ATP-dependent DNA helicase [Sciscionella sp.]
MPDSPATSAIATRTLTTTTPTASTLPEVSALLGTAVAALGGSERAGQVRMAQAVDKAIRTGVHLAVQAGTGTGKSLAYLVPAVRHAVESGDTVVVSTSTIALQRQLIDRDLPKLADALRDKLGREPVFAILKGRGNYLCLHRLRGDEPVEPDEELFDPFAVSALGRQVKRVHEWAADTETGDRDELVPGVPDQAWRQVSVSARECLGVTKCPVGADCFAELARAEAGRADVVVTNHALLAIDAIGGNPVLPEHAVVIVDEAHDLVDRVTSVATEELSAATVSTATRRCSKLVDERVADRLAEAGDALTIAFGERPPGRIDALPEQLAQALMTCRDAAHECISALGPSRREDVADATARKLALALLDQVHDTSARILASFEFPLPQRKDVVWLSGGGDSDRQPMLHVAPLSVGGLLRTRLFGRSTVILTSATLALGGTFDALARQWGLSPESTPPEPIEGMA